MQSNNNINLTELVFDNDFLENTIIIESNEEEVNENNIILKENERLNVLFKSKNSFFENLKDLVKEKSFIYIFCLNSNNKENENNMNIFKKILTIDELDKLKNNFTLIKFNKYLMYNNEYNKNIIQVNENNLDQFNYYNNNNYKLEINDIIIPILEANDEDIKLIKEYLYPENYNNFDKEKDKVIFKSILINKLMNINADNIYDKLEKELLSVDFWTKEKNCILSIDEAFKTREFSLEVDINNPNIKAVSKINKLQKMDMYEFDKVDKIDKIDKENKVKNFIDGKTSLINNSTRTFYATDKLRYNNETINYETVNFLFKNYNTEVEKEKKKLIKLFNMLLVSKDYCSLILNNNFILEKMTQIINENFDLYRYLFSYAWLTLYLEESIFKTKTDNEKRYVFDINTATNLPVFPVINTNLNFNPYLPLLINNEVLNENNHILSLKHQISNYNTQYGLCNLEIFKKRFDIFTSGLSSVNKDKKIFNNIIWNTKENKEDIEIAISGSIMTACCQKEIPLLKLLKQKYKDKNDNELLDLYYSLYYKDADIDLMFKTNKVFPFLDKCYEVIKQLNENIYPENNNSIKLNIESKKTIGIIINNEYLKLMIKDINDELNKKYNYEELIEQINNGNKEIREYFYQQYIDYKKNSNKKNRKEKISENILYNKFYELSHIDNMTIYITDNQYVYTEEYSNNDYQYVLYMNELINKINSDIKEENNKMKLYEKDFIGYKISESIKFSISDKNMPHKVEAFRVSGNSFFKTVAKFHLPCVRSFYNGNNVYMVPSFISAMMTGINIDYKYFAGSKNPIDIMNKYRMRGFGIIINTREKELISKYNKDLKFGFQKMISPIFNVNKEFNNITLNEMTFDSFNEYKEMLKNNKKINFDKQIINTLNLKSIDTNGKLIPLNPIVFHV